jgi:hypothetical protein
LIPPVDNNIDNLIGITPEIIHEDEEHSVSVQDDDHTNVLSPNYDEGTADGDDDNVDSFVQDKTPEEGIRASTASMPAHTAVVPAGYLQDIDPKMTPYTKIRWKMCCNLSCVDTETTAQFISTS